MTTLLDGKKLSQKMKEDIALAVKDWIDQGGCQPGLATILVGNDSASEIYIRNKIKSTKACGMASFHEQLPSTISEDELLEKIKKLNHNSKVHGILVQLPLPNHISEKKVLEAIDPKKDVDGFHLINQGKLLTNQTGLRPCTPLGVMALLKAYEISLAGKEVVIVGRSNIVGKPQALLMLHENATVTIAHSRTKNLEEHVRRADVLVAAVGKPKMIPGEWLKKGSVVVDVGINRLPDGKLCGDVDFELAKEKASHITPVPGGVGPMTIAMLMANTLQAAKS